MKRKYYTFDEFERQSDCRHLHISPDISLLADSSYVRTTTWHSITSRAGARYWGTRLGPGESVDVVVCLCKYN